VEAEGDRQGARPLARLARFADLDDQVEACRRVFASDTRWTVVRGTDIKEGESQGLPVWSRHVGSFSGVTPTGCFGVHRASTSVHGSNSGAFSAWRSLIARPLTLAFAALASLGEGFLSERTAEPNTTQYVVLLGPRIAASSTTPDYCA
jgi:hypothetical protein